ncbi:MBL fold metallo-hydrolase [Gymnodinialimonas hymeniacidonis]|uniref:MBL fold metallo-hydrolase n=1 Tax=Gymnodinialimonas hymeniacidonis TaxID=3126508 RepID=UPI0034C62AFD
MLCKIGDVEVWRILEMNGPFREAEMLFPTAGPDVARIMNELAPGQVDAAGKVVLPVQGFLLKTGTHVVLVDACVGNHKTNNFPDWNMRDSGRFMAALEASGTAPGDVDYVMCTHLHTDHVGWNTRLVDGRWLPTFPNARYLMPASDLPFLEEVGPDQYRESVLPVVEAEQVEEVGADFKIGDAISLIATRGHTPGHVSVRITSGGAEAVITGDAIHCTPQCAYPDWHFVYDADKEAAVAARRHLLETVAESGAKVLGTHFLLPSTGRVVAKGDAFRWQAD